MPAGRPPIWTDPTAFDNAVDAYFEACKAAEEPPLWTGLALHLGFESRDSLNDYAAKPEFSYSVKKALMRIENKYEKSALTAKNPAAPIFALKNFGWKDKSEIDSTIKQEVTFKDAE